MVLSLAPFLKEQEIQIRKNNLIVCFVIGEVACPKTWKKPRCDLNFFSTQTYLPS